MTLVRLLLVPALALASCGGTTGGEVVDFRAAAAGPEHARAGEPYAFATDRGWEVTLTRADLHIGALYLVQAIPVSGGQTTACVLPSTYVAEVTTGRDIDLLDGTPQPFPAAGRGTTERARAAQVWLTGGAVDDVADETPILVVEGRARRATEERAFEGRVTIGPNRQPSSGATAGANPICKQRIVSPIPVDLAVERSGELLLRIDPRLLFSNIDFGALVRSADGRYRFSDEPAQTDSNSPFFYSQPSANLYQNLHSAGNLYRFVWERARY